MTLLLLLCLVSYLPGSLNIDPGLNWYTLETDHFAVHFSSHGKPDDDARELAGRVAALAEDVHDKLTGLTNWTPQSPTQVIIADFFDYANGWAAPLPDNTITILPFLPAGSRTNYDDWLRTLLVHEYAHIIQMDMTRGITVGLRRVFGRAVLANALMPIWSLEGYAQYYETRLTDFGRLTSPEYDMMIRAAARAGKLLPIDQCGSYELQRYPGGRAPYLYGGLFYQYLADRSDPGIWDRYSLRHAGGVPFFDNFHARRTFGSGFHRLWQQWQNAVVRHAESTEHRLRQKPLTPLKQITGQGFSTSSPFWSRTGAELYYISRTGKEYPAIKAVDTAGHHTRVLHRGRVTGNISLSPDGRRLAFSELHRNNYYDYSDIFALDLYQGTVRRLTHGLRAQDPDFSPDTCSLVFVSSHNGRNDLMLLALSTGEIQNLTETESPTAYHSPRFSPDGRYVAVGVNRPGGYADIELLDLSTGWHIPVTEHRANDLSPSWSRTGRHLFFVSDRTGVFNLYAYSVETQQTYRCSNVLYGLFEPAVSPDNRTIALVSHSAQGDDICLTRLNARAWHPAEPYQNDRLRPRVTPCVAQGCHPTTSDIYYYNPFPTILPKLWLPLIAFDSSWSLGAFTFGWDALQFHRYLAAAGYRFGRTPFLNIQYQLSRYYPVIQLSGDFDFDSQSAGLNLEFPFRTTRRTTWLGLGTLARHDTQFTTRFNLGLATSNAFRYRFGIAPSQGGVTGFSTDLESRSIISPRDRARLLAYHTQYLGSPPRTQSLRLRIAAGTAFGDTSANTVWHIHPGPGILEVRGFSVQSDPGRSIIATGLQFRTPLCWPERGPGLGPLFLRNINLALFSDWAMVWNRCLPTSQDWGNSRLGIGAELRADLVLAHLLPTNLSVGFALGLRPETDRQLYLKLESSLLAELLDRVRPDRFELRTTH